MKKVKVAQIGTSKYSHGSAIWKSIIKQTDVFEVVGYALPENEREKFAQQMVIFDGYPELTVEEILNDPRRGKTMRQLEQWGILPYKKFWYDGSFFTLLTFKNDIVIEAEEIYGGGYGFKPWGFVFLLIAPMFL